MNMETNPKTRRDTWKLWAAMQRERMKAATPKAARRLRKADDWRLQQIAAMLAEAQTAAEILLGIDVTGRESILEIAEAVRFQAGALIREIEAVTVPSAEYDAHLDALNHDMRTAGIAPRFAFPNLKARRRAKS